MKFKALGSTLPEEQLEKEFASAQQAGKFSLSENCIFYRRLLCTDYICINEVQRVYRRAEESRSTMGCCAQIFLTHFLVTVLPDGKPHKMEAERQDQVDRMLEWIGAAAPQIPQGFVKA